MHQQSRQMEVLSANGERSVVLMSLQTSMVITTGHSEYRKRTNKMLPSSLSLGIESHSIWSNVECKFSWALTNMDSLDLPIGT
ncbi:hypothetical protein OH492_11820 [Vibrio chagasii]|nr:hypothetical protein [Vibrio chagasii]